MSNGVYNDIQFPIPDGWEDASTIVLIKPAKAAFTPNITVTRDTLDSPMSAQAYAESQRGVLEDEFSSNGYHIFREGPVTVGQSQAYQRHHTFVVPDGEVPVQQLQVYVVKGEVAITITATDHAEQFEHTKPLFIEAIRRFKFIDE